jgi:1-acyl-sn-glycerol-3-phosphate acyltransferase
MPSSLHPTPRAPPQGLENIPAGKVVFASNHQSFVDPSLIACALPLAHFKCLFKYSLMYVPGVGSTLWFSGHIPVKRDDKTSTKGSLSRAKDALGNGQPVVFFVEGTRVTKQTLGDFKLGAFIAAKEKQAPIVPITISGARALMPPSSLPRMLWGDIVITIHPPVPPPALDAELTPTIDAVRGIIASALRPIDEVTPVTSAAGAAADAAAVSDKAKKP